MLGTAWPAMRQSFGAPVGDLGLILLVNTLGSVVIAAFVGRLIQKLRISALLAVAASCAALSGLGYAAAPGLWLILAIGPLLGAAIGMIDGGLNTAVALTGRPRLLNLLHGFYGIGTALGPLIVTAAILAGSWRPAYLFLAALDFAAAALWVLHHRRVPPPGALRAPSGTDTGQGAEVTDPAAAWSRQRLVSVLALGLIVFFVYTGLEVSAGQWQTSYLRGHLNMSASSAGLASFGYWGTLTAVRIGLALPAKPVPPRHVIGWGLAVSVVAAALIWLATRHRGHRGRVRHPRRRPRRCLPGPHRHHPPADRRAASPARHRLASRRRRSRRIRHFRTPRPPHRHHQPQPSSAPPSSPSPCSSSWPTQPWPDSSYTAAPVTRGHPAPGNSCASVDGRCFSGAYRVQRCGVRVRVAVGLLEPGEQLEQACWATRGGSPATSRARCGIWTGDGPALAVQGDEHGEQRDQSHHDQHQDHDQHPQQDRIPAQLLR